jgi:hypothetical protein
MVKIKCLLTAIVLLACITGNGQLKGFSLGPYAEIAWPRGDLGQTNKNGIGAGFGGDIRLGKLGLTGSIGFIHFGGKTVNTGDAMEDLPANNVIPVRAGLKFHVFPLVYAKLEGGVAKYTNGDNAAFILSPGVGVRLLGFDVQAKYEAWIKDGNSSFLGLKVGYNF